MKRILRRSVLVGFLSLWVFVLLCKLYPLPTLPPQSAAVYAGDSSLLHLYLTKDDKWRLGVAEHQIPPQLISYLLFKEDRYFFQHPGVNPGAIARALISNIFQGRRVSGASTLSMQVARMLEPAPRTWRSKLWESFRALQLEMSLSKGEVLQYYFSLAPYGGNVEGLVAASLRYYSVLPKDLLPREALELVLIPNDPNRLKRGSLLLQKEVEKWSIKLKDAQLVEADELAVLQEQLPTEYYKYPKEAFHLSQRVHIHDYSTYTFIDKPLQLRLERICMKAAERSQAYDVENAATLVIRNRDGAVVGYVGSADPKNNYIEGQVDMLSALRSPGSTLKPFLYLEAIEKHGITPRTRLLDVPRNFNGYQPVNYEGGFFEEVTAQFALEQSLNLPAVALLEKVGLQTFLGTLDQKYQLSNIASEKGKLGLSVILGGCGVYLDELAAAYLSLARGGTYLPLKLVKSEATSTSTLSISSTEATAMLRQMLPNFLVIYSSNGIEHPEPVYYKTGTSYGHRDAYAIGYNSEYTVLVWQGNASGRGAAELSGAAFAVPLLKQIFYVLPHNNLAKNDEAQLASREVCSYSGKLPSSNCAATVTDLYIVGTSSEAICELEQVVHCDEEHSYCAHCTPKGASLRQRTYFKYEPELSSYMRSRGAFLPEPPPHYPLCNKLASTTLTIESPAEGYTYFLEGKERVIIPLQAAYAVGNQPMQWYVDGQLLPPEDGGTLQLAELGVGWHTAAVTTADGSRATRTFEVKQLYD